MTPAVVFLANIALFLTALVLAELVPDSRGTFATAAATLGAVCAPVALVSFIAAAMVVRGVRPIIVWLACLSGATIAAAASLPLYLVVFGVGLSVGFVLALPVVIGAAEELAKVCSLFWLIRRREYDTELHGLVFGAAAGLGFASVENVGYLVAAYRRGGIDLIAATMLARLLTSLVHAALSSSLAAVLWRERRVSVQVTNPVLFTYILVSILHAVWNYQVLPQTPTSAAVLMMVFSGICIAVLFLVRLRLACLPSRKTRT
ncbi:MAG: PrsW family glutamic-type intramembrane protease [Armatimonadota bacterium]